jgi:hypothetical protein
MIGGSYSKRRKHKIREQFIPFKINKCSIQPLKRRSGTLVRPGIFLVQQGQLNETHVVDASIEGFSFGEMKIVIVLLMAIPNHVEVTTDHPRNISGRDNGPELIKKSRAKIRGGRGINIGNKNKEVGKGGGEVDRDGVGVERVLRQLKKESDQAVSMPPEEPRAGGEERAIKTVR